MLGLAAAAVMLTAVGVAAMSFADEPTGPVDAAGTVSSAASLPGTATPSPSRAQVRNAARTSRPPAATPTPASTIANQVSVSSAPPASHPVAPTSSPGRLSSRPAQTVRPLTATSNDSYARAVFGAVNQARAGQHLPALAWSSRLQQSARQHDVAMAAANTLAHQVGGEASLGARETAAGVQWSFAAENIGWTTDRTLAGALGIEASMLAEPAGNDAHRRNILSSQAHAIGIDVLIDNAHGRLWLTEDFADVG